MSGSLITITIVIPAKAGIQGNNLVMFFQFFFYFLGKENYWNNQFK